MRLMVANNELKSQTTELCDLEGNYKNSTGICTNEVTITYGCKWRNLEDATSGRLNVYVNLEIRERKWLTDFEIFTKYHQMIIDQ